MFLAASIARTENWCAPTATLEYAFGVAQAAQPVPSSLHSKLDPASLEEKAKPAEVEVVVAAGPLVIDVLGGVVSGGGGGVGGGGVGMGGGGVGMGVGV